MNIKDRIEVLEAEIAELNLVLNDGYEVDDYTRSNNYYVIGLHTTIKDIDGNLAGIVVNEGLMKKYFERCK